LFTRLSEQTKDGFDALLIETEHKLGLKDLALKHLVPLLNNLRNEIPQEVFTPLFAKQAEIATAWWKYLRARHAKEPTLAVLQRLVTLLEGKLPPTEFTALLDEAEQASRKLPAVERDQRLHALVETCPLVGREDLTPTYLEKWAAVAVSP